MKKLLLILLTIFAYSTLYAETWTKVISTNDIDLNGEYIIASTKYAMGHSIGTSKFMPKVDLGNTIDSENTEITDPSEDVARVKFIGNSISSVKLQIFDSNGASKGYYTTTAAKSMSLSSNGTNASVSISDNGDVTIDFGNVGILYYNSSAPRFLNYTSSQTKIQLFKKEAVVDPSLEACGLSYETTKFSVVADQTFTAPVLSNPNNLTDITYTSSNTDVATVDAETGNVTLIGATGTTTITAKFAGDDTYAAGSASYTITVIPAPYHNLKDLVKNGKDGDDFIAVGNFAVLYQSGANLLVTDGESNVLVYGSDVPSYEIGTKISKIEGKVTIYANSKLFELTGTTLTEGGEGATYTATEISSNKDVTIAENLFDEIILKGKLSGVSGKNATLTFENGETIALYNTFNITEGFENAANVTVTGFVWQYNGNLQIAPISIEKPEQKKNPELSYSKEIVEVILGYNDAEFEAPALSNPNNLTVTYESSNEEVATIDAAGKVTLIGAIGETTISASFEENDEYAEATVSYTITVKEMEACATPTFSATEIYAGESITITCATKGATITYTLNGETATYTEPIVFDTVGEYTITATATNDGYKESEAAVATITVTEKPLVETIDFTNKGYSNQEKIETASAGSIVTFTFNQGTNSNNAPAYYSTGTAVRLYAKNTLTISVPDGYAITGISFTTDKTNNTFNEETSVTAGTLNNLTWTAGNDVVNNVSITNGGTKGHIRIQTITVNYEIVPKSPVVLVNGEAIDGSVIDLDGGSVELTLTAEEGHHIYHKHVPTIVAADYYFDVVEEGEHAGFNKVESNEATVTVNQNGTLTFYAHNPETMKKGVPVSLTFERDQTTSISEIEAAGKVEYFDMQGRRVAAPANGLFIRREGNAATKVRL